MVKETRIVFEIRDIVAVRIRHKPCGGEVLQRLGDEWLIPDVCPMCRREWSPDLEDDLEYTARINLENRFKSILRTPAGVALLRLLEDALGIGEGRKNATSIRFELNGKEDQHGA